MPRLRAAGDARRTLAAASRPGNPGYPSRLHDMGGRRGGPCRDAQTRLQFARDTSHDANLRITNRGGGVW